MRIYTAAKFGAIASIGVIVRSLATFGLMRIVWANRISGVAEKAIVTLVLVSVAGLAVTLIYLFVVIDVFVDRKLEAEDIVSPEE